MCAALTPLPAQGPLSFSSRLSLSTTAATAKLANARSLHPECRARAPTAAAASGPKPEDPHSSGVPARSRSCHSLQGVQAAEAQDAGVLRADRRSLSDPSDAHARSLADCAKHREGAPAQRRADRSHRARARSRAHSVRSCRRTRAQRPHPGRLQSLRAEPPHRRRARERRPGAQPDLGSPRRDRAALERQERHAGRGGSRTSREHDRRPDCSRRRHHRLRQSRHRRCGAGRDPGSGDVAQVARRGVGRTHRPSESAGWSPTSCFRRSMAG